MGAEAGINAEMFQVQILSTRPACDLCPPAPHSSVDIIICYDDENLLPNDCFPFQWESADNYVFSALTRLISETNTVH